MTRLLLDSHVFIWMGGRSRQISPAVAKRIDDAPERPLISAAAIAELCIKASLGKLDLPAAISQDPLRGFADTLRGAGVDCLPITLEHAATLRNLPLHHRDPFDRLMIAQAMSEGLTLVTHDRAFALYDGLSVLWA